MRERQGEEEEAEAEGVEGGEEEGGEIIAESLNNLTIETGGIEEEAAEVLEAALGGGVTGDSGRG